MTNRLKLTRPLGCFMVVVAGLSFVAVTPAAEKPAKKADAGKFLRIRRDTASQPAALETAVVHYVPTDGDSGLQVDLVGAIHVGDRSYYEALNKQFEQYDVLLYELVAPPGTRIPKGGRNPTDNPLAFLQHMMKSVLALESQVELVDYTKKNFVHADLSPEQMAEAIRKRGDDGLTIGLSVIADLMRQQNLQELRRQAQPSKDEDDFDPLALLLDPDASVKLKRLMAQQFEDLFGAPGGGLGRTLETILIADRNAAAMKVFQREMAKGKKKIGIFYGVAHLPDFDKRLREDFGLKRSGEQWLTAWDLKPKKSGLGGLLKLFED